MALQLKNKVDKEKKETSLTKKGKYKRKRDVFGKRLTRFGLIGVIIGLVVAFAVVKTVFTLRQNSKQKKIDEDLLNVQNEIKDYKRKINKKADSYENVGELIATLPATFDRQATSLDLDRMVILSGLTESTIVTRTMAESENMPFECSVDTVKSVKITMTLYGKVDDVDSVLTFMNYLVDYTHENFYYIESVNFTEDKAVLKRTTTSIILYTFYNDVTLVNPTEPTGNTNTNTNTTTQTA